MAATYGPTWAQTTAARGLGAVAGLSSAERMDEAMLQKQKQEQNALALDTTRLQQQRTGQLLEQEELNLRKLRDMEAWRSGTNVSGAAAAPIVSPTYSGGTLTQASPSVFDPAAVQAGADYTQSNYEAAAFGGTPPAVITSDAAPAASAAKQPPPMRDAAKLVKDLEPVWANLEGRFGLPNGYLRRTAEIESSLDPNAQNPNSSAGGLFQFIDGTAAEFNLENRFDPIQASNAAAKLASRNARILAGVLGRQPTAGELYLAHQQGAGGASVLLDPANQDKKAVDVVSDPQFVLLNGGDENMSVSQFVSKWGKEKWAGDRYTFEQRQALNRGEGPAGLKGNVYNAERGQGLAVDRMVNEFRKNNLARGEMDFRFPSPVEPKEAAGLYPSGEEVLAAAEKTGARPGQRPLPATAGGTFTLTQLDVPIIIPPSLTPVNYVQYNPTTQEIRGPNGQLLPEYLIDPAVRAQALEGAAYNFNESAQNSVDSLTGRVAALKAELDSASPTEYAGKLQTYTDTLAQLNNAKAQLDGSYSELPGSLRTTRNVFSGEGPDANITPEIEAANLKKLQDAEVKVNEVAATVTKVEQEVTAGTLTPTEIQAKIDAAVQVAVKTAGLNTSGKPKVDGTVKPKASVYSLDPAKFANAQTMIQEAEGTLAILEDLQKLSRLAGDRTAFAKYALEIRNLRQNMTNTKSYLKGMDVIRQVKGGDLMPFVNLMANTFKTNDVELRETDGKWTLFVNGQENPTVNAMTQDDISNHIGYLFDEDYKAASIAVSTSTVEFQQEIMMETHKAALKYTGELNNAASESARQAVLERIKNSGKFTQMGDSTRYQYTNEQGQIRIMDTEVLNPIDPEGLPSTVIYRIEGTGLVPVDS